MLIQQILLKIFITFQRERTISAAYHLLKGKRSGQTIQDVGLYKLYPFFGLLPKFPRQKFDEQIDLLFAKNYIVLEENGFYTMTEQGIQLANEPLPISFDSWNYRGNEHVFFSRLALIVQSLSHQANGVKTFIPIERNELVQDWVRQFLIQHRFQTNPLQKPLFNELEKSLQQAAIDEQIKDIIVYRLSGYEEAGSTWQQLAFGYRSQELDVQLSYISGLHHWLNEIYTQQTSYPYLHQIAENIRVDTFLTTSANETAKLYKKGYSIEEISHMRRLKTSTIEDHIVELAMNDPQFTIDSFVSKEDQQLILTAVEDYETKKLKTLREIVPHVSYFQLRVTLAKGVEVECN